MAYYQFVNCSGMIGLLNIFAECRCGMDMMRLSEKFLFLIFCVFGIYFNLCKKNNYLLARDDSG